MSDELMELSCKIATNSFDAGFCSAIVSLLKIDKSEQATKNAIMLYKFCGSPSLDYLRELGLCNESVKILMKFISIMEGKKE